LRIRSGNEVCCRRGLDAREAREAICHLLLSIASHAGPNDFWIDDRVDIVQMSDQSYDSEEVFPGVASEVPDYPTGGKDDGYWASKVALVAREAGMPDADAGKVQFRGL
jgi:hypothetical protein